MSSSSFVLVLVLDFSRVFPRTRTTEEDEHERIFKHPLRIQFPSWLPHSLDIDIFQIADADFHQRRIVIEIEAVGDNGHFRRFPLPVQFLE